MKFNIYGAESGRMDSSKPNLSNTPQSQRDICLECGSSSNPEGPRVHRTDCSKFGYARRKLMLPEAKTAKLTLSLQDLREVWADILYGDFVGTVFVVQFPKEQV